MGADTKLALIMIALGFIGVPLACWLLCWWADHSDDYVARRCREANRRYFKWEQEQRRRRRRRK